MCRSYAKLMLLLLTLIATDSIQRISAFRKWSNSTIPYMFHCPFFTPEDMDNFQRAFDAFHDSTCIEFMQLTEPNPNIRNFITITCIPDGRLSTFLGMKGGLQFMNLARSNFKTISESDVHRKLLHMLMHTLGFRHEYRIRERDEYVGMHDSYLTGPNSYFFTKLENYTFSHLPGCEFDFESIMMVGPEAQHGNTFNVYAPIVTDVPENLGMAEHLSKCDIQRINHIYCE